MFIRISLILVSFCGLILGASAAQPASPLVATCQRLILRLGDVVPTQAGLRHDEEYMKRLGLYLGKNGRLPSPVKVGRFEDGRLFVLDGHHGLELLGRQGVTALEPGRDYTVRDWTYADFDAINHVAGWVTPFDPRTHVRLPQLLPYKKFVHELSRHLPQSELEAFIRRHPEAYLAPRTDDAGVHQFEGATRDRAAYFREMDRSMAMKVGQLLGAIPSEGILWEPGTGSGAQAAAYAAYYPNLLVVGTDLDIKSIRFAQSNFVFPNLLYMLGNALAPDFPSSFVDAVEDSSAGHHFVSYGRTGEDFREKNIEDYRGEVARILKAGGHYAMRDFVSPEWPARVRLVLSDRPGAGTGFGAFSKAELFKDFAKNFRSHDYDGSAALVQELPSADGTVRVFEAPGEFAANFMLRIAYTDNWQAEMHEQYTYYSQAEHQSSLLAHGMRVDFSLAYRNPWIEKNWWPQDVVSVQKIDGSPLDLPPTNLILYARKLRPHDIKSIDVKSVSPVKGKSWMSLQSYRSSLDGSRRDLITVPGVTRTFVPFETSASGNFIFIVPDSVRPALVYYSKLSGFDGAEYSGITSDSFSAVVPGVPAADSLQILSKVLEEKGTTTLGARAMEQIELQPGPTLLPSPGTSDELVQVTYVDMRGEGSANVFAHATSKRVEVKQFLAATNMGSIPDGRLQAATYELARAKGWDLGMWSGGELSSGQRADAHGLNLAPSYTALSEGNPQNEWRRSVSPVSPYLAFENVVFEHRFASGESKDVSLEFARPQKLSVNTVSTIPYCFVNGELHIGFEAYSLPSFEQRGFKPTQHVVPAFRLSSEVKDRIALFSETRAKWKINFASDPKLQNLGEGYFPSPGQTPEKVFPFAVDVSGVSKLPRLNFVPWSQLQKEMPLVSDMHSRVAIYRLVHALGL